MKTPRKLQEITELILAAARKRYSPMTSSR